MTYLFNSLGVSVPIAVLLIVLTMALTLLYLNKKLFGFCEHPWCFRRSKITTIAGQEVKNHCRVHYVLWKVAEDKRRASEIIKPVPDEIILCEKCSHLATYNRRTKKYHCSSCGWKKGP